MKYTIICIFVLLFSSYIVKRRFFGKISPYDSKFWAGTEFIWLFVTFLALPTALSEFNRIDKIQEQQEIRLKLVEKLHNIQAIIYGKTTVMSIEKSTQNNESESIKWFTTMQKFLNEGLESDNWRGFLYFTKAFVFKEKGFINANQDKALMYKWPEDLNLKSVDIIYKKDMKAITDSLYSLQLKVAKLEVERSENEVPIMRLIFGLFFCVFFSLKALKTYADYKRTLINTES